MPAKAPVHGFGPPLFPALPLLLVEPGVKQLRPLVTLRNQIHQIGHQPGLYPGHQGNAAGRALQIQGPPNREPGAVGLGLQQRIGGRCSTVHSQFPEVMAQGGSG